MLLTDDVFDAGGTFEKRQVAILNDWCLTDRREVFYGLRGEDWVSVVED